MVSKVVLVLAFALIISGLMGLFISRISKDDSTLVLAGAILLGFSVYRGK